MVYRFRMSLDRYWLFYTSVHLLSINPKEYAPSLTELDLLLTNILGISVCKWNFKDYNVNIRDSMTYLTIMKRRTSFISERMYCIQDPQVFLKLGNGWKKMLTGVQSMGNFLLNALVLAFPNLAKLLLLQMTVFRM